MTSNSRSFLETELRIMLQQLTKLSPGTVSADEGSEDAVKVMNDVELIARVDELKDLLRTIGGVRRR